MRCPGAVGRDNICLTLVVAVVTAMVRTPTGTRRALFFSCRQQRGGEGGEQGLMRYLVTNRPGGGSLALFRIDKVEGVGVGVKSFNLRMPL